MQSLSFISSFTRFGLPALLLLLSTQALHAQESMLVPLTDVSTNKLPYIIAKEQGLFDKYGVSIDLYLTPGAAVKGAGDGMTPNEEYVQDPKTDRLLSTGGGVGQVNGRVNRGGDRVILGTTGDKMVYWIYAREGIDRLEDLKGGSLSATGIDTSCTGAIVHIVAERMGWEIGSDIHLVENDEHRLDKMIEGEYDAVVVTELPQIYAEDLGLKPLVNLRDWGLPFVCSGISASKSWLETGNNREKAKRFLMATIEAIAIMKQQPQVVYDALDKWYGVRDMETKKKMYETVEMLPKKPYPAVDGIKLIMETYDTPAMRKYKPEDFYDDSLMKEIDESGFIDNLYR